MAPPDVPARPRLRPVEAFPVKIEEEEYVCLRDPQELAEKPVFLNRTMVFLVSRMDGKRSLRDIQVEFARASGRILAIEKLEELVRQLDDYHYLDNQSFLEYRGRLEKEFRRGSRRPAKYAGSAYPADGEALGREFDDIFSRANPAGARIRPEARPHVRGLIAPHIDFARGAPTYGQAYGALRGSKARRFILFGTSHNPMERRFAFTSKDFDTPLGTVRTDRRFVEGLAARLDVDYFHDEFAHRTEHSIEFQVVCLQYLLRERGGFTIVPILVGSFHDIFTAGKTAGDEPEIVAMVDAVRGTMEEFPAVHCIIAGADLAHVGRRFGDPSGPTEQTLRAVESDDRELLALIEAGDAEGMFQCVARARDKRRVCGYPPIYMTLRCLGDSKGRLLQYRQWSDLEAGAAVTFSAVALQ